jgi:fatty acid desaturase
MLAMIVVHNCCHDQYNKRPNETDGSCSSPKTTIPVPLVHFWIGHLRGHKFACIVAEYTSPYYPGIGNRCQ